MRDLVLLVVTFACSVVAVLQPALGLLSYLGYALVNPQGYTWYIRTEVSLSKIIALSTFFGFVFSSDKKTLPREREVYLLIALWVVFGLSTLHALDPYRANSQIILVSKILLMTLLTVCLINSQQRLQLFFKVIALSIGLYGLKGGIYVIVTGAQYPIFGPPDTYLAANNTLGMAIAMNVPLLFYLSKQESRVWLRWVFRGMLVFSYPAVIGTFARGDWVGLAGITALLLIKSKRKVLTVTVATFFCVTIVTAWLPYIVSEEVADRFATLQNYEEDQSVQLRFIAWDFCIRVGTARPLLGGGFGVYSQRTYKMYLPEVPDLLFDKIVPNCHNTWLATLAEHGVTGLLLFVGLFVSCLLSLRQIRIYGNSHERLSLLADYADMLQVALIGFAIMGVFADFAYYEIYYQLVAAIIIMKGQVRQDAMETSSIAIESRKLSPL